MLENVEYNCLPGLFAAFNEKILNNCSVLYSNHYGKWGEKGVRPGKNIRLSTDKIREWLENENVNIYYATINDKIIGYAIAFSLDVNNYGIVTWVTQLVVHKEYRNHGIAKNILFSIWGFTNHYAWGIVSANPYAIRALEKATRRRATPIRIKKNSIKLRNIGQTNVPFMHEDTILNVSKDKSTINTEFFVDHGNTEKMLSSVTNDNLPWLLGMLEEGWEWFAFTFKDQEQIKLTTEEIENMVITSNSVVKTAYSRMKLDPKYHKWMSRTKEEVDYILNKTKSNAINLVYDLGCGTGRHSIELAQRGYKVVGIDYIPENIKTAAEKISKLNIENIDIIEDDCRYYKNNQKALLVLCLYDVIGSFANDSDNVKIIKTIYNLLQPNGIAIISVMNYELTLANAKYTFKFEENANKLLDLNATNIQEKSGDIFDPRFYMVDTSTHIVYRREQFSSGTKLPIELIVRDRRFTMCEIVELCESIGFTILEKKYTSAKDWSKSYDATNSSSKEILLTCQKLA